MPVDIQEPVQGAIWQCLNHHCYSGATFLAERLEAEVHSEESLYLLATCYYRAGRRNQAMQLLKCKGVRSFKCRYLLALCCFELNNLQAAEQCLVGDDVLKPKTLDEICVEMGDTASFALELLGQIYVQSERRTKAVEAFNKALSLNPFMWPAFENLCNMGEKPDVSKVFQVGGLENFTQCSGTSYLSSSFALGVASSTPHLSDTRPDSLRSYDLTVSSVNTPMQPITTAEVGVSNISTPLASVAPVAHPISSYVTPEDQGIPQNPISTLAPNRLRSAPPRFKSFSTTHSMSPYSPSFGVLPLESTSFGDASHSSFTGHSMAPAPLNETNDTFLMPKRLANRKEATAAPARMGVFCQSGNTATTPSYVSTPAQSVRRSSRLYSSNNSVKENNKAAVSSAKTTRFATPRQNVKRTRTRAETSDSIGGPINEFQELNLKDENRERDDKVEKIVMSTPTAQHNFNPDLSLAQKVTMLQKQASEGLMSLLRLIGDSYVCLSQYECRKALELIDELPLNQKNTGWVLSRMARLHFELGEYKEAKKLFEEVQKLEPYRTDHMEYYSAALWQLEDAVSLSALALHLQELNSMDAATWCCTGTALALNREHEAAIKCFQRAIKLNPKFPWAYTLLGHEYMAIEEMEKAVACFNNAVRIDRRHYNGWYAIGLVYQKQEQNLRALHYFRTALAINKQHPILKCHLALVQHALQRPDAALQILDNVLEEHPRHPLCKFQRASIYFARDRYSDALRELEELKKIVPDEAAVFYLMGNVFKKMNDTHSALMHFSRATDLDPKGASHFMKEKPDATISLSMNKLPSHEGHDTEDITEGEGLNQSGESNNFSSESLEFPVQPAMDSDDGDQD